jgi:hypothetical protein
VLLPLAPDPTTFLLAWSHKSHRAPERVERSGNGVECGEGEPGRNTRWSMSRGRPSHRVVDACEMIRARRIMWHCGVVLFDRRSSRCVSEVSKVGYRSWWAAVLRVTSQYGSASCRNWYISLVTAVSDRLRPAPVIFLTIYIPRCTLCTYVNACRLHFKSSLTSCVQLVEGR